MWFLVLFGFVVASIIQPDCLFPPGEKNLGVEGLGLLSLMWPGVGPLFLGGCPWLLLVLSKRGASAIWGVQGLELVHNVS